MVVSVPVRYKYLLPRVQWDGDTARDWWTGGIRQGWSRDVSLCFPASLRLSPLPGLGHYGILCWSPDLGHHRILCRSPDLTQQHHKHSPSSWMVLPVFIFGNTWTFCSCFSSREETMTLFESMTETFPGSGNASRPVMVQELSSSLIWWFILSHSTTWPFGITVQPDIQGSYLSLLVFIFTLLWDFIFLSISIFVEPVLCDFPGCLLSCLVRLRWEFYRSQCFDACNQVSKISAARYNGMVPCSRQLAMVIFTVVTKVIRGSLRNSVWIPSFFHSINTDHTRAREIHHMPCLMT